MTYQYQAISADGEKINGTLDAVDEYAAVAQLRAMYTIVLNVKPQKEKGGILSKEIGTRKIDQKALSVMCSQFSIILQSGVPIDTCMSLVSKQVKDKGLRRMLEKSAEDVSKGNSIATSFKKNCPHLPPTFIETIKAGEESGTIENSFATLQRYYDKSFKTKQKIKQALAYPSFVLSVAVVVLIIVMTTVVPSIATTFLDLGGDMPLITKLLIKMSDFFRENILWICVVLIAIVMLFRIYIKTEVGKRSWSTFYLKLPIIGNIGILNTCSQIANTMAALLNAGLSVSRALEITGRVLDNYMIGKEISQMTERIEQGKRLGECMRACKFLPDALVEMCTIGEETGELERTLDTIGSYYDNEAQHATEKAIQKMEPATLMLMAGFAGFIVCAIYLPMFYMYELI
ncbi:MAG: type II secretion system F family protein [Candidatus Ruminococcus intestinipullorum]|nr:type II secretion system F family protein [Candidatus Ruminococcus intestinipullorum]